MLKLKITNETSRLLTVVVGIAEDFGGTPDIEACYDPKSRNHVLAGTFPQQEAVVKEMNNLIKVLERYNVNIIRPYNIYGLNQIFSRDIAFVIEDKIVVANIIKNREKELEAYDIILKQLPDTDRIEMPEGARAEGGDVMLCNEYIFVGFSEKDDFENYIVSRTNKAGLNFLSATFTSKKVKGFELKKSDNDPRENALHLDCCFQPIGKNMAILYKGGFKNKEDIDFLLDYFGEDNIIEINKEEMYNMNANVFSISEDVICSEKGFFRLNTELRKRGFKVEEVCYSEIAKMEGLLRCSTMPLIRE
tara:strand:- start:238 stop:1152 length:915 start_codon:yes stop_codon:yes gene_type:complete